MCYGWYLAVLPKPYAVVGGAFSECDAGIKGVWLLNWSADGPGTVLGVSAIHPGQVA